MTVRKYFKVNLNKSTFVEEKECEFKYYNGFAYSQKQKSIKEFHKEISNVENMDNILEISTKSTVELGVRLSAFNLKVECNGDYYNLENLFQSSKVFEKAGPFKDLLKVTPKDAKTDDRLTTSGDLIYFDYNGTKFDLNPKTFFYDWIYIQALKYNNDLTNQLVKYDIFTDIEFNHKKSINCQARSAAFYVGLFRSGMLEHALMDLAFFKSLYNEHNASDEQITFSL